MTFVLLLVMCYELMRNVEQSDLVEEVVTVEEDLMVLFLDTVMLEELDKVQEHGMEEDHIVQNLAKPIKITIVFSNRYNDTTMLLKNYLREDIILHDFLGVSQLNRT